MERHEVVLVWGPYDGVTFPLDYPPSTALSFRDERYTWADYADANGRPVYVHHPEVPVEDCRVIE